MLHTPAQQEPGVTVERLQTKKGTPAKVGERAYDKETGRLAQVGLVQQIAMLPTPRAGNPGSRPNEKGGKILAEEIAKALIPTPASRDYKGGSVNNPYDTVDSLIETGATKGGTGQKTGLKLHSDFVSWMQGYPLDWMDV